MYWFKTMICETRHFKRKPPIIFECQKHKMLEHNHNK